jgi:hypothetical protein
VTTPARPELANAPPQVRALLDDALRYWEPRRILYNLVLVAVVLAWLILTWPHFRPALTLQALLLMFVLAVLANVCYCADEIYPYVPAP